MHKLTHYFKNDQLKHQVIGQRSKVTVTILANSGRVIIKKYVFVHVLTRSSKVMSISMQMCFCFVLEEMEETHAQKQQTQQMISSREEV